MNPLVSLVVDSLERKEHEPFALDDRARRFVRVKGDVVPAFAERERDADLRIQVADEWPARDQKTRHRQSEVSTSEPGSA